MDAFDREAVLLEHLPDPCFDDLATTVEDALEKLVFALEVVVDGALAQSGSVGDVLHARVRDALLREHGDRRVEDLPPALLALLVARLPHSGDPDHQVRNLARRRRAPSRWTPARDHD